MGSAGDRILRAIHEARPAIGRKAEAMGGRSHIPTLWRGCAMGNEPDDFFSNISETEQALFDVLDALEQASVDPRERKILWPDGASLSIEETAGRIQSQSGSPLDMVQSHVVGWLEMIHEPVGLDEDQMEEFESLVEKWITPYDDTR